MYEMWAAGGEILSLASRIFGIKSIFSAADKALEVTKSVVKQQNRHLNIILVFQTKR